MAANAGIVTFQIPGSGLEMYRSSGSGTLRLWTGAVDFAGPSVLNGTWYCALITKPTGTSTVRWHLYDYNTGLWSHSDGASIANITPTSSTWLGIYLGSSEWFPGNIQIAAVWNSDFNDAAIEALRLPSNYTSWINAAPVEGWLLDKSETILSFGITGTSDETARVGTTLASDSPPGWIPNDFYTPPVFRSRGG